MLRWLCPPLQGKELGRSWGSGTSSRRCRDYWTSVAGVREHMGGEARAESFGQTVPVQPRATQHAAGAVFSALFSGEGTGRFEERPSGGGLLLLLTGMKRKPEMCLSYVKQEALCFGFQGRLIQIVTGWLNTTAIYFVRFQGTRSLRL